MFSWLSYASVPLWPCPFFTRSIITKEKEGDTSTGPQTLDRRPRRDIKLRRVSRALAKAFRTSYWLNGAQ
jgi:hypothetical protein